MNTMNMPGFTAEVSVYRTSERYHARVAASYHQAGGAIHPAFLDRACYSECVFDCLHEEGHPRPSLCIRACRGACTV